MSRSRYTFLILCFGIAVICFLGLTQSAPITLEVTASWYPWVAPDDVPMYDDWDDAIAVESLVRFLMYPGQQCLIMPPETSRLDMKSTNSATPWTISGKSWKTTSSPLARWESVRY